MNYLFSSFCLALCLITFAAEAKAQSSRMYYTGYMGLTVHREDDVTERNAGLTGDYEMDNTISFAHALGLRLNRNWRVEAEMSVRKNSMNNINFETSGTFPLGGEIRTWLYMANLYYDFDYVWRDLRPFIGVGLGLASHDVEIEDTSGLAADATGENIEMAWQLGGGVTYQIKPNLAMITDYRYIGTSDMQIQEYNLDYSAHELRVGVQYDIPVKFFQDML